MCTSKATVVYGLAVRSTSLYFAVDAWSRLKKTLPFFDLVSLRRRSGTLKTSVPSRRVAVTKVPDEIWREIEFWLVREEVAVAEDKLVSNLRGEISDDDEEDLAYFSEDYFARKRMTWDSFESSERSGMVEGAYQEWIIQDAISSLVSQFGLTLGSRNPIVTEDFYDPQALALVTAPSHFVKGNSPQTFVGTDREGDQGSIENTIVNISVDLPTRINRRFTRLVRLFRLEVVDAAINEISGGPKGFHRTKKMKSRTSPIIGVGNKVTKKIQPRWILWTTCESNW
ncbi:hypothetical protein JCM16303_006809 [Sporobolomyces ruberrimus]